MRVPAGVWARVLASRLPTAWRRRSSSPTTSMPGAMRSSTGHAGCSILWSVAISVASRLSSTRWRSSGRPWSSLASRSRSSTSTPIRSASDSIRAMIIARSSGRSDAPRRYSSAYPRTEVSGVRSSCPASATKRRSRLSDARRSSKARSICASIAFSDALRRPTSVPGSPTSTRWERSPAAIAAAVSSMRRSGRSSTRTSAHASAAGDDDHDQPDQELEPVEPVKRRADARRRDRDDEPSRRDLPRPAEPGGPRTGRRTAGTMNHRGRRQRPQPVSGGRGVSERRGGRGLPQLPRRSVIAVIVRVGTGCRSEERRPRRRRVAGRCRRTTARPGRRR